MTKRLTYRQLFKKLKALGYKEVSAEPNGLRQRIFRHPDHPRATIFLPETTLEEPVTAMHLGAVRMVLTNHGVAQIDPDQVFLQSLAATEEGA